MKRIANPLGGRIEHNGRDIGYDYRRKVGDYVREHREAVGLTQREVAKALNVHSNTISAIELGRNPVPPERYRAMADVLGLNHKKFGRFLLEFTDPWLFGMIYGEERVAGHNLQDISPRVMPENDA